MSTEQRRYAAHNNPSTTTTLRHHSSGGDNNNPGDRPEAPPPEAPTGPHRTQLRRLAQPCPVDNNSEWRPRVQNGHAVSNSWSSIDRQRNENNWRLADDTTPGWNPTRTLHASTSSSSSSSSSEDYPSNRIASTDNTGRRLHLSNSRSNRPEYRQLSVYHPTTSSSTSSSSSSSTSPSDRPLRAIRQPPYSYHGTHNTAPIPPTTNHLHSSSTMSSSPSSNPPGPYLLNRYPPASPWSGSSPDRLRSDNGNSGSPGTITHQPYRQPPPPPVVQRKRSRSPDGVTRNDRTDSNSRFTPQRRRSVNLSDQPLHNGTGEHDSPQQHEGVQRASAELMPPPPPPMMPRFDHHHDQRARYNNYAERHSANSTPTGEHEDTLLQAMQAAIASREGAEPEDPDEALALELAREELQRANEPRFMMHRIMEHIRPVTANRNNYNHRPNHYNHNHNPNHQRAQSSNANLYNNRVGGVQHQHRRHPTHTHQPHNNGSDGGQPHNGNGGGNYGNGNGNRAFRSVQSSSEGDFADSVVSTPSPPPLPHFAHNHGHAHNTTVHCPYGHVTDRRARAVRHDDTDDDSEEETLHDAWASGHIPVHVYHQYHDRMGLGGFSAMDDDDDDEEAYVRRDVDDSDEETLMVHAVNPMDMHHMLLNLSRRGFDHEQGWFGGASLAAFIAQRQAFGPALDVDHMSYEQLLELSASIGNVSVAFTADQIEKHSQLCHLTQSDLDGWRLKQQLQCCICYEEFAVGEKCRSLSCGHTFHAEDCIDKWLAQSKLCPVCKQEVCR